MTTTSSNPGDRGQPLEGPQCRKCGCRHLPVQHTRRSGNRIIRYRKCRHCGLAMCTSERVAGDDDT